MNLMWPFVVWFTNGIFAEDRAIVEMEQAAHDSQSADWNQEIFPAIRALKELLLAQGRSAPRSAGTQGGPVAAETYPRASNCSLAAAALPPEFRGS